MNRFSAFLLLLFCSCLILSKLSYAQQIDSIELQQILEMPLEDILNFEVLTSSKTPRLSTEVTQKVDIVSEAQINQMISGNRNIAEFIQYLPGASVKVLSRNDANWGAYGGIGPKYNTYMIQGLPIDAFMDPMNIDAMVIKHIEIQRGPASVLYPNYLSQDFAGNQSPLAGTVNLILKEQIDKPQTIVSYGLGSYNTHTGQGYHESNFGRLHFFGGISVEKSDYTNYGSDNSWLNIKKNPEYLKGKLFLGSTVFLDNKEKHKITLFGHHTLHEGDAGREFREYNNRYNLVNLGYSGKLTDNLELTLKTGLRLYDREWQGDSYDTIRLEYELADVSGVEQRIIPLDLSLTFNHLYNSNFTVGADFQHASYSTWDQPVDTTKLIGNDAIVTQMGMYIQEELQLNKFTVRGGARYNIINYNIARIGGKIPGSDRKEWGVLLLSAGTKLRLNDELILFSNIGNSFMSPGLKSIGGTIQMDDPGSNGQWPNPDLEPESGMSIDLGIDYSLLSNINISIRTFRTSITDAIIDIVVSEVPSQTMSENAKGKTLAQGLEFSIKQHIDKKIDWFTNITFIHSEIEDPDNPDQDDVEAPFVPELMSNAGITLYLPYRIEICPYLHLGGTIYDSNSKSNRNSFESNEVVNLMIMKSFTLNDVNTLDAYIKAHNLTDNKYEMPWQFRDPGFTFTAGIKLIF